MNIEKLAKHLKEFTLDEIEMIAEVDCKTAIKQLLNEHKIVFKNGKYEYMEQKSLDFDIFSITEKTNKDITIEKAIEYFLKDYVAIHCKAKTYRTYRGTFKFDILPFFKNKILNDLDINEIKNFYKICVERDLKPLRIKNTLALLKQFIKYFQEIGMIDSKCNFQVRRITKKNEFNLSRITFKENL